MKRLLLIAAAVAGIFGYRKWKESEADKSAWSRSTDTVD
jgi:hypothetical protein